MPDHGHNAHCHEPGQALAVAQAGRLRAEGLEVLVGRAFEMGEFIF
jgi:hypothetical protein